MTYKWTCSYTKKYNCSMVKQWKYMHVSKCIAMLSNSSAQLANALFHFFILIQQQRQSTQLWLKKYNIYMSCTQPPCVPVHKCKKTSSFLDRWIYLDVLQQSAPASTIGNKQKQTNCKNQIYFPRHVQSMKMYPACCWNLVDLPLP